MADKTGADRAGADKAGADKAVAAKAAAVKEGNPTADTKADTKSGGSKTGGHKTGGHAHDAGHGGSTSENMRAEGVRGEAGGAERGIAEQPVAKLCREVLAAIVEADGGEMYLVAVNAEDIHIHLAGTCSGCPGATLTSDRILGPALAAVAPKAKLRVTTGWRVPEGAKRVEAGKT